jgi:hypothetical protein
MAAGWPSIDEVDVSVLPKVSRPTLSDEWSSAGSSNRGRRLSQRLAIKSQAALAKSEFHFGSLKLREADFAAVLAITKRRNSATPVICRTATPPGWGHCNCARRRTFKGLVPYFGEP